MGREVFGVFNTEDGETTGVEVVSTGAWGVLGSTKRLRSNPAGEAGWCANSGVSLRGKGDMGFGVVDLASARGTTPCGGCIIGAECIMGGYIGEYICVVGGGMPYTGGVGIGAGAVVTTGGGGSGSPIPRKL